MEAFGGILGKGMSEKQLMQMFMKIDANSDGTVDWDEFMNFMLLENQSLDTMTVDSTFYELNVKPDPSAAYDTQDIHKEMVTKIISVVEEVGPERKKVHKYITAGRDGKIKSWSPSNLEVTQTISVVNKAWVTTICYMTRSGVLAVGAGDRTLTFYDLLTAQPTSKITLKDGMPLCMAYWYNASQGKEVLAVGDDLGILHMFVMHGKWHMCDLQVLKEKGLTCHITELEAKREKMFCEAHPGKDQSVGTSTSYSAKKLGLDKRQFQLQHIENVAIKEFRVHEGWITRVLIVEDLDCIITSSLDGFVHVFAPVFATLSSTASRTTNTREHANCTRRGSTRWCGRRPAVSSQAAAKSVKCTFLARSSR